MPYCRPRLKPFFRALELHVDESQVFLGLAVYSTCFCLGVLIGTFCTSCSSLCPVNDPQSPYFSAATLGFSFYTLYVTTFSLYLLLDAIAQRHHSSPCGHTPCEAADPWSCFGRKEQLVASLHRPTMVAGKRSTAYRWC